MRLSRHAKNRMRQYEIVRQDVCETLAKGARVDADEDGNPVFACQIEGRWIGLVLALDDIDTVITVYPFET